MKRLVVKIGGHAMASLEPSSASLVELAQDVAHLVSGGTEVAIVHGGGPQIEELLETVKVESRFHEGLRVTDTATMEYVAMALGRVNLLVTAAFNHAGVPGVGLSGADGSLFVSKSMGEPWQRAGATPRVRTEVVTSLWANGFSPIICSLAVDKAGELVNCNADTAAGALAGALDADALVLLSDVDQVRDDPDDPSTALSRLSAAQLSALLDGGAARDGMVPKLRAALDALGAGALRVVLANGTRHHALRDAMSGAVPTTEIVP
ncbi:MAG: acetylglutamate kinase [Acidimicrobiales bacterium]